MIKDSLLSIAFGFLESIKRKSVVVDFNESKFKNLTPKKIVGKALVYP